MMKPKEIQKLIELVEKSDISELEVSRWGRRVRITKSSAASVAKSSADSVVISSTPHPIQPLPAITAPAPVATVETIEISATAKAPDQNVFEVKSPMVGTFYRAPAPDATPYVQVGDIVSQNQVLCIIEAMKLMNEIESEVRGRIIEISVENARPVEYNQVLFKIEKL
jgi:acetyl-CoA carboxylase biotin carboxyl carrier protein